MRYLLILLLQIGLVSSLPLSAAAQQTLVSDPEIYEKDHFRGRCKTADFEEGFITRLDINNDGLIDAVLDEGKLVCDGERGPDCTDEGCPYNLYLQVKEGGYLMIATARMYGYEFIKRFGNMVFVMKMHPKYCERTDTEPCMMTVRVRGTKLVTLFKK